MKTIWKYPLKPAVDQYIDLPINAEILTVQLQNNTAHVWAIVDPDSRKEKRHIRIHGTGHQISSAGGVLKYISTIQMDNGTLVYHVFEVKP